MLPIADTVYWTEVKANVEGDVIMPALDRSQWTEVWREEHAADEKHAYPFAFVRYEKKIK
jgi:dihydrofolate reductase